MDKNHVRQLLQVYFIMGSNNCQIKPEKVLEEAIDGGITLFQFREKGENALTGSAKVELARSLQKICQQRQIPFIINDDIELAIEIDADGVHIGQEDEPIEVVRKKLGSKIIGVSAHTIEEVQLAIAQGADYLGIGPIFATSTKPDAKAVQGTKLIEMIRQQSIDIPIVGIGGINATNAASVISAGADGVSIISAISLSAEPKQSTMQIKEAISGV